jgi:hypothetical protein
VTDPAAQFAFFDERSAALFVVGIVVELEPVARSTIDAHAIALLHHPALTRGGMALPARRIDRPALRVMDQRPQERHRRDPFDHTPRDRRSVVE